jgi:hypothetical protein
MPTGCKRLFMVMNNRRGGVNFWPCAKVAVNEITDYSNKNLICRLSTRHHCFDCLGIVRWPVRWQRRHFGGYNYNSSLLPQASFFQAGVGNNNYFSAEPA